MWNCVRIEGGMISKLWSRKNAFYLVKKALNLVQNAFNLVQNTSYLVESQSLSNI